MNNTHINEVFNFITPNETQKQRILRGLTQKAGRRRRLYLPKKPLVAACSLIMIAALCVKVVVPMLHSANKRKRVELKAF